MSNTIKIKHGSGAPTGKLQPYELGYNTANGSLYIGISSTEASQLTSPAVMGLVNSSNYIVLPKITNANTDTDKFLVCDSSSQIKYRTGAEVRSDIGAFPASGGTLITTEGNWGDVDPNSAKIPGTNGQLYFVLI